MFKFSGAIMVVFSSVFISSQRILGYYFTYCFLNRTTEAIEKIIYEKDINMPYSIIYKHIEFCPDIHIRKAKSNGYINRREIEMVESFFNNLGRHNRQTEEFYINNNCEKINTRKEFYYSQYIKNRKIHLLCGVTIGMFIVIVFV